MRLVRCASRHIGLDVLRYILRRIHSLGLVRHILRHVHARRAGRRHRCARRNIAGNGKAAFLRHGLGRRNGSRLLAGFLLLFLGFLRFISGGIFAVIVLQKIEQRNLFFRGVSAGAGRRGRSRCAFAAFRNDESRLRHGRRRWRCRTRRRLYGGLRCGTGSVFSLRCNRCYQ